MESNEVKPSFSFKYLFLVALTAVIVAGVGFGLSKLYEARAIHEITVIKGYSINVIDDTSLPKDKIEVEYYLKGEERKKISSLFRNKVIIKNSGNVGVSNLQVTAILKNKKAELVDSPKLESSPSNILDVISVSKSENSTNKKHLWVISLLNPGESISFDYSIFSEGKIDTVLFELIARKKDLKVKQEELTLAKDISTSEWIFTIFFGVILSLVSVFLVALPFYLIQWVRRPEYREHYLNFSKFYNEHSPKNLFKPFVVENIANKKINKDT
jgi:hypothetical protein